jgi:hypothetical protein
MLKNRSLTKKKFLMITFTLWTCSGTYIASYFKPFQTKLRVIRYKRLLDLHVSRKGLCDTFLSHKTHLQINAQLLRAERQRNEAT